MKGSISFGLALSLFGALIIYAATGLYELGLGAMLFNMLMIGGMIYAEKNQNSKRRKA